MATDFPFTLSIPAQWLLKLMPPVIQFGSPVQRSKAENQGWWHVPVTVMPRWRIGPAILPNASAFLDLYEGETRTRRLNMKWGDAAFQVSEKFRDFVALERGRVFLVPVALRREAPDALQAYITDRGFFRGPETTTSLPPDRRKRRFKLGVQHGNRRVLSDHFYIVRVPRGQSNSNFTVEMEYEGAGTDPLAAD
jgi:hypothetical protein